MTATATSMLDELAGMIGYIAGRCDGFDGLDTKAGKRLAAVPVDAWTDNMVAYAFELTRKYRGQLEAGGYDVDSLPEPTRGTAAVGRADARSVERAHRDKAARTVTVDEGEGVARIAFRYNSQLVAAVKQLPGRRWQPAAKQWTVPLAYAAAVLRFAEDHGFAVDAALADHAGDTPADDQTPAVSLPVDVDHGNARFTFKADYHPDYNAELRAIGARWNGARRWHELADVHADRVADLIGRWQDDPRYTVTVTSAADEALRLAVRARELRQLSRAHDAPDVTVPGLGGALRPFQRAAVAYAIATRRTLIGDEMGCGKTIEALAAAHHQHAYPIVVVCPAVVKLNWADEALTWLPNPTVHVLHGSARDLIAHTADVIVCNYDILHSHAASLPTPGALILDEAHYLKTPGRWLDDDELADARQQAADETSDQTPQGRAKAANRVRPYAGARRTAAAHQLVGRTLEDDGMVMALTGTPVLNRASELASMLDVIGRLDDLGGKTQVERLAKDGTALNEALRGTCMVRRTKAEVLPDLPPKQRSRVRVELDGDALGEYERAERDVIAYVAEQARQAAEDLGVDPDSAAVEAKLRASAAEHLVAINQLRRIAARAKLDHAERWVRDFQQSGSSLVVFGYHRDVTLGMAERFGAQALVGGVSDDQRQRAKDAFQAGDDPVLVCSTRAAGVGLTLTRASDVLFCELDWTPAALEQAEDRCHRIGADADSVDVRYLIATRSSGEPTIDEDMWALVEDKRALAARLVDGVDEADDSQEARRAREQASEAMSGSVAGDVVARILART